MKGIFQKAIIEIENNKIKKEIIKKKIVYFLFQSLTPIREKKLRIQ